MMKIEEIASRKLSPLGNDQSKTGLNRSDLKGKMNPI